jgi:hypothetical protein
LAVAAVEELVTAVVVEADSVEEVLEVFLLALEQTEQIIPLEAVAEFLVLLM